MSNQRTSLLTDDGQVKLTDFGLARQYDGDANLTMPGTQIGTFDYMSPEQLKGSDAVDHRCDIYGLGATLYQCLTGDPPRSIRSERIPAVIRPGGDEGHGGRAGLALSNR